MASEPLLATLDKIAALPELSMTAVASVLGIKMSAIDASDNLKIYQGGGDKWKSAELRVSEKKPKRGILILDLASPIPLDDATRKYGQNYNIIPPNPAAPEATGVAYEYRAKRGVIRFITRALEDRQVHKIVFDRF